jgi:putative spermidine/putrescine transport system ATP-binding protein
MADLHLSGISKSFGSAHAVEPLDLSVTDGAFVTLLGPSGCGKTTILRMVAGIATPDAGEIRIGGRRVDGLPPEARNVGLVFQSYALFPHMTVAQNVGFGLRMRGITRAAAVPRIAAALDLVDLGHLAARYPRELSGGQQQRVALARALVIEPDLLLLDEPLSNLDAKLRDQLREDLRTLTDRLGVTTIYVTHDQSEAMALSDRILVMRAGRIVEDGAPEALYRRPRTRFTAEFLGQTNVVPVVHRAGRTILPWGEALPAVAFGVDAGHVSIRPEDIALIPTTQGQARVTARTFLGAAVEYRVVLGDSVLRVRETGSGVPLLPEGTDVTLSLRVPPHPLAEVAAVPEAADPGRPAAGSDAPESAAAE